MPRLSPDEARRRVLEDDRGDSDLWSLGDAVARSEQAFPGEISAALVADLLMVGEVNGWPSVTRPGESEDKSFQPHVVIHDADEARRSWLPEDLPPEAEDALRVFATTTRNPFVAARVFEVLWLRFGGYKDGLLAVDARLRCAPLCDPESSWPRMVDNLGRLTRNVLALNAKGQWAALVAALDEAAQRLLACTRAFAFVELADMVSGLLVRRTEGRAAFTPDRGEQWARELSTLAENFSADPHHGTDALLVLQAWQVRWGKADEAAHAQRRAVRNLQEIARQGGPRRAPMHLQRALKLAVDFGLAELVEPVRLQLMQAIQAAVPTFEKHSVPLSVPPENLAFVERLAEASADLSAALMQLAVLPGLLEIDLGGFRAAARAQLAEAPFLAMPPSTHLHPDGKVTSRSEDLEGSVGRHAAMLVDMNLAQIELLLLHFLKRALPRFESATVFGAVGAWPHLSASRAELLAVASERFAAQDWVSSAFIVIPLYEALLRDLLRAGGYSALKLEPGGVLMDETIGSLLRGQVARGALGAAHCDLAEHVFCNAGLGWNLRNEVAHGTITRLRLSPSRVLLVWLFVIRLTSRVALSVGQRGPDAAEDANVPLPDAAEDANVPQREEATRETPNQ